MRRGVLAATLPLAVASFVFGTIFGAAAEPLLGAALAVVASAVVYSGSVQFAMAAVLLSGASPLAAVLAASILNLRNLVLGAVMRSRLSVGPLRRAGLSWFLTDEAVGLTLAGAGRPETVLLVAGVVLYVAWNAGTVLGVLGASLVGLASLAEAVFPVLFIGLAAIAAVRKDLVLRAVAAAAITAGIVALWPAGRGVAPVAAVVIVAFPGKLE